MQAHKIELLVVDHDDVGAEDIKQILENTKYPNHCMLPEVKRIVTKDIGEWHDEHPLNYTNAAADDYYKKLFSKNMMET